MVSAVRRRSGFRRNANIQRPRIPVSVADRDGGNVRANLPALTALFAGNPSNDDCRV